MDTDLRTKINSIISSNSSNPHQSMNIIYNNLESYYKNYIGNSNSISKEDTFYLAFIARILHDITSINYKIKN